MPLKALLSSLRSTINCTCIRYVIIVILTAILHETLGMYQV